MRICQRDSELWNNNDRLAPQKSTHLPELVTASSGNSELITGYQTRDQLGEIAEKMWLGISEPCVRDLRVRGLNIFRDLCHHKLAPICGKACLHHSVETPVRAAWITLNLWREQSTPRRYQMCSSVIFFLLPYFTFHAETIKQVCDFLSWRGKFSNPEQRGRQQVRQQTIPAGCLRWH